MGIIFAPLASSELASVHCAIPGSIRRPSTRSTRVSSGTSIKMKASTMRPSIVTRTERRQLKQHVQEHHFQVVIEYGIRWRTNRHRPPIALIYQRPLALWLEHRCEGNRPIAILLLQHRNKNNIFALKKLINKRKNNNTTNHILVKTTLYTVHFSFLLTFTLLGR